MKKKIIETLKSMEVYKDCLRKHNMDTVQGLYGVYRKRTGSLITTMKGEGDPEQLLDKVQPVLDAFEDNAEIVDFAAISLSRRNRIAIAFKLNKYSYDFKNDSHIGFGIVYISSNDGFSRCTFVPVVFFEDGFVPISRSKRKLITALQYINKYHLKVIDSLHNNYYFKLHRDSLSRKLRLRVLFRTDIYEDYLELATKRFFEHNSNLDIFQYLSIRYKRWFNAPQLFLSKTNAIGGTLFGIKSK
ncbi:MAG: hypothetical protein OMM_05808 [Candidatus Magnetoglobus multicellularis str. Araruama]|uniref:Uncharacterized protein n=1 Tax=Candidatus Magnetoglobus multicellularis str. Araruama TaxID=890399 RepID=A0A1V1NU36_9BACT|nr:MAG: hypothetical protein OMM_05808 [Candidatus Magnetoglobus multicellularis str. Araruama]